MVVVVCVSPSRMRSSGALASCASVAPPDGAAADEQGQSGFIFKQLDNPAAEYAVATDDQDFQITTHAKNLQ